MHNYNIGNKKELPRILIFLLIFMFCAIGVSLATEDDVVESVQFRVKGYMYQRQGELDKAIENYKLSIEANPFYACAHNDLGILYEQVGKPEKAEAEYLLAVKVDPTYVNVYTNLAMFYERTGQFEKACYYWQKRANMGDLNDKWTQYAKEKYKELCAVLAEQERVKQEKAKKEAERKQRKEARKAKRLHKPVVKSEEIQMTETKQVPVETMKSAQTSVEPSDLAKKLASEVTAEREKKLKESQKMQEYAKVCQKYLDKADKYLAKGDYDSAIRQYRKVQAVVPFYPHIEELINDAQKMKLERVEGIKNKADQQRQLKEDIKSKKKEIREREKIEKKQGKYRQEIEEEQQELKSKNADVEQIEPKKVLRAKTREKVSQQAPEDYKQSLRENYLTDTVSKEETPEQLRIARQIGQYLKKAERYLANGRYSSARREYEKIKKLDPDNEIDVETIIEQERDQAEADAKKGIIRISWFPEKDRDVYFKIKEAAEKERIEQLKEYRAKKMREYIGRYQKYLTTGRTTLALEQYNKIQKLDPEKPVDIDTINEEAQKLQLEKKAQQYFDKGKRFYDDGKYKEAELQLKLSLDLNPDNGEAYRLLKYCQRRTQRTYYGPGVSQSQMETRPPEIRQQQIAPVVVSAAPKVNVVKPQAVSSYNAPAQEASSDVEKRISQEVQNEQKSSPTLTTAEIEKKYQIVGVVAYRSQTNDVAALNEELLKKAKAMGADEVIQVKYFQHVDSVYGYGTAVKKKK